MQVNKIIEFPDTFAFDVSDYCTEEEFNELNLQEYLCSLIYNSKKTRENYNNRPDTFKKGRSFIDFQKDHFKFDAGPLEIRDSIESMCSTDLARKLPIISIYNRFIIDKLIFRVNSIDKINAEQNITINNQNSTINFHLIDIRCLKQKVNKLEDINIKQNNINNNMIDEINHTNIRNEEWININTEQTRIINIFKDNIKYLEEKIDEINEVNINQSNNNDDYNNKIKLLEEKIDTLQNNSTKAMESNINYKNVIEVLLFIICMLYLI